MTSTPSPSTLRVSVTVTPEVYAAFKRLADAGSMSMSRAMGDWLGDTVEAAEFMAEKMEQARAAPRIVMREMHAYALGLADETGAMLDQIRKKGRTASVRGGSRAPGPADTSPPVGNTGGKVPRTMPRPRGGKSA